MDFFSRYDFDTEIKFKSLAVQNNVKYPADYNNIKKIFPKLKLRAYTFDSEFPMVSPIMGKSKNEVIDFIGDVVLTEDYTPMQPIIITNSAKVDLNNKKIIAPLFSENGGDVVKGESDSYGFWVKEGAVLTIDGKGEVIAQNAQYSMAVWANGGDVIINDGAFYNGGDNCDLIYASNGSHVKIYGGEFHPSENKGAAGTKNKYTALNIKDKDRGNTTIEVFGGKFYGFNPANNLSEGEGTNFVAEGYKSVEVEPEVWEVVKE